MVTTKLSSIRAGADRLGVKPARVYGMIRDGVLPAGVVVYLGRQVRINSEALEAWITSGGQRLGGGWKRQAEQRGD